MMTELLLALIIAFLAIPGLWDIVAALIAG